MAILFAMLAGGVLAQSQELFWDINGTDPGASGSTTAAGTWNDTNTYWNTDSTGGDGGTGDTIGAWQPGSVAVFSAGGNATGTFTVSVSGTHQIGGLRFEEGTVSVNGGILQFSGGATFTHNPAAGDCPVNSAVQGNGVLTLDGSGNWGRLNGVVSENGGTLSVNLASGNWVFGGQHTYTGDMTITGYAVPTVGSTGSASSGNLTSGPFGTGTLILTSGLLRPTSGGAITIGNAVRLDGSFTFGETSNTHDLTFTGPLTLTGTRTLTTNGSTVFFDGALGDDGNAYGFTKAGTSALVLGGENTFTGAATINNGTLRLANAGALNSTAPVAVSFSSNSNTKTLQLAGHSVTVSGLSTGGTVGTSIVENNAAGTATLSVNNAAANTFAGVLRDGGAGALALTKTGAGTLTLSGSSSNTYTGLTTVSDGVLTLSKSGGATAIAGDILINGGRVSLGAAHQIADSSSITVDSGVWYNSQTETVNNLTINSAPTVSGYSWHLINNLNVGGTLKVTAGDVVVGSGGSAQANAVELTGGVLAVAANAADSTFSIGSGGLAMSGGELRLGYSGEASTALINLGGNFTGSGTASISTRNSSGPRLLDLQSATRTFDVTSGTTTVQPTIQNGGLTKTGDGTLILSGPAANTYTGLTTVNGGTLILNKTAGVNAVAGEIVVNSGTLDLGADNQIADASDITVNGSANFNNNARLETVRNVTLNSSYSNPGNHRVSNMTITGTLAVTNGVVGLNSNTDTTANTVNMSGGRIEMAADTAPTIFNVGSGGLTMSGATLRFGWGGIGSAETAQVNLGGDFTGSGTNSLDYLTLNAPRLLDLQGATRTFNVTGGTTTISPTIQNGGLTKTGGGTLTFSGSNENTYTGLTTVSGGTLALGKTAGVNAVAGNINVTGGTLTLNAANQIADTSDVTVSGAGRFSTGGPNYAETVRNLMMDSSVTDPNINRVSNLTVTDTLTVKRGAVGVNSGFSATAGTLDMSGGSIIGLAGNTANTTVHIGNGGLIMSDATLRFGWIWSGILDSPYTIRVNLAGDFTGSGTNSLDYITTLGPRLLDLQVATRTFNITGGTTTISPTIQNGGLTKTGSGALVLAGANTYTGGVTIENGELRLGHAGALNTTSPNVVTFSNNANDKILTLNGHSVTVAGLNNSGGSGAVVQNNAAGTATLTVNNAGASTYAGVLRDGTAGVLALTKSGGGTLTLSGSSPNTYTGLTTVSAGTLALGKTAGINAIAGNINVTGGTLTLNAANQIADTSGITVSGAGRFSTGGPNYAETVRNLTMDSSVTDPNINRVSNLTVTDTLTVKRGAVGVNSGFSATAGTLDMSGGSIIGLAGNTANTTVHIGNGGLIMSDATLRFGWIWSGILDSPYTIRVNLAGDFTGSGTNSLDYVTTLGPRLLDLQVATRTFNITGGTTTISPTIQNGGLTKTGAGALVLSGANTYTGPTTVDAGLLLVNGTHTGGGAYSVHGSGTLGGTGSIGSVVGVGAGGKLAPGASIGTLAIGDHLTLAGGSTFEWEFNSDSLTADLLNVDGDLALLGNVSLDLVDLAAPAGALPVDTKFTLISYSGDWNGGVFEDYANYSTFTSGLNEWRIRYNDVAPDLNGAFGSFVTLRVIPEPSSIVLLLAAVFGLLLRRRARFSRNRAPAYP